MYLPVLVFVTAMLGPAESIDPQGPVDTLEACEARVYEALPSMKLYLSQFGLKEIHGECRVDNSKAI